MPPFSLNSSTPDTVAGVCGQVAIAPAGDEDVCSAGGGVWKGSNILSAYLQVVFFPGKYTGSSRTNIKALFKLCIYIYIYNGRVCDREPQCR